MDTKWQKNYVIKGMELGLFNDDNIATDGWGNHWVQSITTYNFTTLSYCGACIWNYILDNFDSNCVIDSFKKHIGRWFLFLNDV